jgi:uncharacterized membrane protein (UPF0127 family)
MARNLKRRGRKAGLRSAVGVGMIACVFTLALAASAALADGTDPAYPGSVLHVTATGPLTPGSVLTITATGTNALTPYPVHLDYGLDLYLVAADAFQTPCATSQGGEEELSINDSPYVTLLTGDVLNEGESGPFTLSLPITLNNGTGHLMICAYSLYNDFDDAAWATTEVAIGGGAAKPSQFSFRRVTLGATSGCWPLARTPSEQTQGLKGVHHPALPMVFLFKTPGTYGFTMTGTPAPLTGVWIGRGNRVMGHWHGVPGSSTLHTPRRPITGAVLYPVDWRTPADGARLRLGARCTSRGKL